MKKFLNLALLVSFAVTVMVPLTGIHIHKLASTLFLLLCVVHTLIHRKKLGAKHLGLLALVLICFLSGIFGMLLDRYPVVLSLHRSASIASIFFLAIHIFVFHRRLIRKV